jgi:hypothetical protein
MVPGAKLLNIEHGHHQRYDLFRLRDGTNEEARNLADDPV